MKQLFVIGAQRSGSTYLYHILNEHPEIQMAAPLRPEPKFFLDEEKYSKGVSYYEETFFSSVDGGVCYIGEKSTSYIEVQVAAERIYNFYPEARILVILRNPVERAFSNYRFSVVNGLEHHSFEDAVDLEEMRLKTAEYQTSVNPFAYIQRGHYVNYLKGYLNIFPEKSLKVLIFEELVGNLDSVRNLYHWLGVSEQFQPEVISEVVNATPSNDISGHGLIENSVRGMGAIYKDSIFELENLLGRPIHVWRNTLGI